MGAKRHSASTVLCETNMATKAGLSPVAAAKRESAPAALDLRQGKEVQMHASSHTPARPLAGASSLSQHDLPGELLGGVLALSGDERAAAALELLRELLSAPEQEGPRAPELLTVAQVAKGCQVHPRTVIRAINAGDLRAVRLPIRGGLRIEPKALDEWIAQCSAEESPTDLSSRRSRAGCSGRRPSGRLELSDV
jgi:excisionase family DNA binding protein